MKTRWKDAGPRERILERAADLFYRQGYSSTGINQILEEAGAHKASLYRYFETKEDLGLAYLEMQDQRFRQFLAAIIEKSGDFPRFAHTWVGLILRDARRRSFHGCPVSNFRSQVDAPDPRIAPRIKDAIEGWLELLADYLAAEQRAGRLKLKAEPQVLSARLMRIYQGSVQLYRMTADINYLASMETEMLAALE
jgi:TetR/AcrR family transcriptional regulator, transcriptional repressor for nem operon